MTVTANTTRNDYLAGSAQSVYSYTFQLNEATDVDVYLDGVKQTLNTHYTVQNVGNASGGTITFTLVDAQNNPIHPTQGDEIAIVMAMDLDRDTNYQPSGAFLASTVNNDFDRLWLATNQQQTDINRSLRLSDTDISNSNMELPLWYNRLGKLLAFNGINGDPEVTDNNYLFWNNAYDNMITSASFTGGNYILTQQDGGTISTSIDGRYLQLTGGTLTGNLNFADNVKANFGNSNELQIYCNGATSFIQEVGSGDLGILASDLVLATSDATQNFLTGAEDGPVNLYYQGSQKLGTSASGISVTGTITATGYNDTNWNTAYSWGNHSQAGYLTSFDITTQTDPKYLRSDVNDTTTGTITAAGIIAGGLTYPTTDGSANQVLVTDGSGTLSFADQSGGSGSSQWTTSGNNIYYNTGNVGIGTTSPDALLHLSANTGATLRLESTDTNITANEVMGAIEWEGNDATTGSSGIAGKIDVITEDATPEYAMRFFTQDNLSGTYELAERMRIRSDGNVGIGATNPSSQLTIKGTGGDTSGFKIQNTNESVKGYFVTDNADSDFVLTYVGSNSAEVKLKHNGNVNLCESSGNVGIGTSSPASKLHVSSTDSVSITQTHTDGNTVSFKQSGTGGDVEWRNGNGEALILTGSQTRMTVDSSGNVGIGTTNPARALHVTGGNDTVRLQSTSSNTKIEMVNTGSTTNEFGFLSNNFFVSPDGTEALRINSSGNVGIGTTSPNSNLELSSATGSATISPTELRITSSTQASDWSTTDSWGVLAFHSKDTSGGGAGNLAEISANMENSVGGFASIDFTLQNPASSYAHTSWLRLRNSASVENRFVEIKADGGLYVENNVGIGTTTPAQPVHIQATTNVPLKIETTHASGNARIEYENASHRRSMGINSDGNFTLYDVDNNKSPFVVIDNSETNTLVVSGSNVGIGTASPARQLVIKNSANAELELFSGASNSGFIYFRDSGDSNIGALGYDHTNNFMNFRVNDAERLRIDSSGNVGIGTTSPSTKLDVNGSFKASGLAYPTSDGTNGQVLSTDGSGALSFVTPTFSSQWTTTGNDIYYTTGNVAIGTSSPAAGANLHIADTVPLLRLESSFSGNMIELLSDDGDCKLSSTKGILVFDSDFNSDNTVLKGFHFKTQGVEVFRIDHNGNVGIGTSSPSLPTGTAGLHIYDGTAPVLKVESGNISAQLYLNNSYSENLIDGTTGTIQYRADANSDQPSLRGHQWFGGSSEFMRLTSSGRLGIATSSPSTELHVNGTTTTDDIYVEDGSASAPAYTFVDDTDTGIFRPANDNIAFVEGGAERMRINSAGRVGIATTNPLEQLHVNGRVRASSFRCTTNGSYIHQAGYFGGAGLEVRHTGSSSSTSFQNMIEFENISATTVGSIKSHGTATQYNTTSDERLKENIQDAGDAGAKIDAIQIRQFDWKDSNHHEDFGVIAQELNEVAPEAVSQGYTEEDMWGVDYSKLVPTLIKEIQSLRNRVAQLENEK